MLARSLLLLVAAALPAVLAKPEQIRAVQSPIFHYYLQAYPEDRCVFVRKTNRRRLVRAATIPVMGPEHSSEYFNIGGWMQSVNTSLFLNIGNDKTSYKTLTFAEATVTDAWGLEGDTIITSRGSNYGRQLNFLVCKLTGDYWQVYLQMGSETPAGRTCSNYQSLHLPCLC
ncbi:uncharacterized protein F4812DRAFT_455406 [Daldinia caldariorum]|uniref:uncharacterized protein n=1 Tax=Daldinia caldariorum TaxID=326644 RepID=UPI00200748F7|nr:uncharacterized protein F4812DRAFT_455406 [Daldinia caldariorum]KAI1471293.1 hypothetical protein F4812DRAFT_455406 [Daldinia caldariorum]